MLWINTQHKSTQQIKTNFCHQNLLQSGLEDDTIRYLLPSILIPLNSTRLTVLISACLPENWATIRMSITICSPYTQCPRCCMCLRYWGKTTATSEGQHGFLVPTILFCLFSKGSGMMRTSGHHGGGGPNWGCREIPVQWNSATP